MIGLTSLWTNGRAAVSEEFDHRRAVFVVGKIDEILIWERTEEQEKDVRFVELGEYLCEVRAKQFWRIENLRSFDEFLEKRFPDSRRKAYYLMAIHEHLPRQIHRDLKQMGWTKARELVKIARAEGKRFNCAPWLLRAKQMPREEFKQEVDRFLTGSEPCELLYFKVYKSQLSVIEQALETAGLMLGTNKSRGYCLEMICADFLAGVNIAEANPEALVFSLRRVYELLPSEQQSRFLHEIASTPCRD